MAGGKGLEFLREYKGKCYPDLHNRVGSNAPTNCEMLHFPMPGRGYVIYYAAGV